nr:MAG TPA: hypothetical protein [Caudoviricetes sp.]
MELEGIKPSSKRLIHRPNSQCGYTTDQSCIPYGLENG